MPTASRQVDGSWIYQLGYVSEAKPAKRTGTPPDSAWELVGVDGAVEGGLRPVPGFRHVVDLPYGYGTTLGAGGTIRGAVGVCLRLSDTSFMHGVLYRVQGTGDDEDRCCFRLVWREGESDTWKYDAAEGFPDGLVEEAFNHENWTAKFFGRLGYVFRSGKEPFLFYFEEDPPGTFTLRVNTDLGPGKPAWLVLPNPNTCDVADKESLPGEPHPDMQEVLPLLTPDEAQTRDVPAEVRVLFLGFSEVEPENDGIHDITNTYLFERNEGSGATDVATSLPGPSALRFPDNSDVFDPGVWDDPTFIPLELRNETGDVTGTVNGLQWDKSARTEDEPMGMNALYGFAVQFFDSRTGRMSPISERLYGYGRDEAWGVSFVQSGMTTLSNGRTIPYYNEVSFPMLYMVYNTTRFDTMLVYRSQVPTATYDSNGNLIIPDLSKLIFSLDSVVTLADVHVSDDGQPVDTDWKVAGVFMAVDDQNLAVQQVLDDSQEYLENMPPGGAAHLLEAILYIGDFNSIDTTGLAGSEKEISGLGLMRWSSPFAQGVENFQALDRYFLELPAEEIIAFARSGPNIIAFSHRSSYLVRRESFTVKAFPLQGGMGLVSPLAVCTYGSEVYHLTAKGLKSVDARGKLSDIVAVNGLLRDAWRADRADCQLVFDEEAGMIFLYNPVRNESVVFWTETSKLTEIHDIPAAYVFEGWLPANTDDPVAHDNKLVTRALWVHEIQSQGGAQTSWRVTAYDYRREKTRLQLLDCGGPTRWALTDAFAGGTEIPSGPWVSGDRPEGAWLYVLDGPSAGTKARVLYRGAGNTSLVVDEAFPVLAAGTRLGLSPVYFRWVGALVNIKGQEGVPERYGRVQRIDSTHVVFTDVDGDAVGSTDAAWRGLVYKGNGEDPVAQAFPYSRRDNTTRVTSVAEGPSDQRAWFRAGGGGIEGAMLCPGVEVFCPDLDFNMLEATIDGKVLPYEAEQIGT